MITETQVIGLLDSINSIEYDISFNKNKIKELMFNNEKLENKQQELRKKIEDIVKDFNQYTEIIDKASEDCFYFELEIKNLLGLIANELNNLTKKLVEIKEDKNIYTYNYLLDFRKDCYSKYNSYLNLDYEYFNQEGNPDIDWQCSEIYTDILSLLKEIQFEKNKLEISN